MALMAPKILTLETCPGASVMQHVLCQWAQPGEHLPGIFLLGLHTSNSSLGSRLPLDPPGQGLWGFVVGEASDEKGTVPKARTFSGNLIQKNHVFPRVPMETKHP